MRILALDIEGGYGGSSRSLYYALKHMPEGAVAAEVWCRKVGPIQLAYTDIGIPTRIEPGIRSIGAVAGLPNSLYDFVRGAVWLMGRDRGLVERLARAAELVDVVHFNHEGLWLLARALRPRVSVPFTMHVRKLLPSNPFARLQVSVIGKSVDQLVYISQGERQAFIGLGNRLTGTVIHNIVEHLGEAQPHPAIPADGRFKVASIANYSWGRGVDRVLDVAQAVKARGRSDIQFVFAGNLALPASLPGRLGEIGLAGGALPDLAREMGLDNCLFLGHVTQPQQVLAACDALIKTARKDFPWGRDILEAMRAGRPVITTGTDRTFVETGRTGQLMPRFDADACAETLSLWADDRDLVASLGSEARTRAATLCDGPAQARALLDVWRTAKREEK
jgi:glycosyltransferase involved in cell wall biosynthesis